LGEREYEDLNNIGVWEWWLSANDRWSCLCAATRV